jgi:spoIIIJ-associated protein
MNNLVEKEGKSVEEAIEAAVKELGVGREEVEVEILDGGAKGLLGLGGSKAKVRVKLKDKRIDAAVNLLEEILNKIKLEGKIGVEVEKDHVLLQVEGKELGLLIGRHGETLQAIQRIINMAVNKEGEGRKILVDIEGYREKRIKSLQNMARRVAEKVAKTGQPIALRPMTSYERRAIHLILRDHKKVRTTSEGVEPNRFVKILPK